MVSGIHLRGVAPNFNLRTSGIALAQRSALNARPANARGALSDGGLEGFDLPGGELGSVWFSITRTGPVRFIVQ